MKFVTGKIVLHTVMACALSLPMVAAERKTLFIDKMNGFERQVESAIRAEEPNVEFIEEREHPDLKILLGKQFSSVYAEVLYKTKLGRDPEVILEAIDVKTKKPIVSHRFVMPANDAGRTHEATEFARKLAATLKKPSL